MEFTYKQQVKQNNFLSYSHIITIKKFTCKQQPQKRLLKKGIFVIVAVVMWSESLCTDTVEILNFL